LKCKKQSAKLQGRQQLLHQRAHTMPSSLVTTTQGVLEGKRNQS
jgi:hypothetical protein